MSVILKRSNMLLLLASLLLISTFFSCSDNSKNVNSVFKALDESLSNSNKIIARSSENIYVSFKDKITDPATKVNAEIWYPKAMLVQKHTDTIIKYIERLKAIVEKKGSLTDDEKNQLYEHLKKYKIDVMSIDPKMTNEFDTTLYLTPRSFDLFHSSNEKFVAELFDSLPKEGILAVLSTFKNNIMIVENRLILFCYNQFTNHGPFHDWISAIVAQSSTYVKAREKIEITAGVGSFPERFKPEITINDRKIPLNGSQIAIYKFSASTKPGKHFVPVEISYLDDDGKKETISKTVEYTVAKD